MTEPSSDSGVRFPPPLIYLGFLLAGLAADRLLGLPSPQIPASWLFGAVPILAGIALIAAALGIFRRHGTAPEPWRPSSAFVATGIYRWTRNPMYLGMALVHLGLAIGLESLGALALLPVALVIVQIQVIAREERYLDARFGEAYRDYRRRVRRWL